MPKIVADLCRACAGREREVACGVPPDRLENLDQGVECATKFLSIESRQLPVDRFMRREPNRQCFLQR